MSSENKKVAVVGLGSMGMGIAESLLHGGFQVIGCDVNTDALARFRQAGGATVATPGDIDADCQIVVCIVVSAAQAEDVLFGASGVAATLQPGALFIACSTVAPDFAVRAAERLASQDVLYLDAPISGGAAKAAAGKLSIMASGSAQAFAKAKGVTDAIAEKLYRVGEKVGQGSSMKMINQLLAGVHIAAAAEAMALAVKVGLDAGMVYEVISNSAGGSWMFENRVPHILAGDYKPRSAISIFLKDLGIVLSAAGNQRFPVPLATTAYQLFTMAASAGMSDWDDAAVAKVYERLSDITLP
jgi:putative dehydrogenase